MAGPDCLEGRLVAVSEGYLMQAFLIDPAEQRVSVVRIDDGLPGIRRLIGFDSIDPDETDSNGVTAVECLAHGLRQERRCRAHAPPDRHRIADEQRRDGVDGRCAALSAC